MKKLIAVLLFSVAAHNTTAGEIGFGIRTSRYGELQAETIGLDMTIELEDRFRINPSVDYIEIDDEIFNEFFDALTLNVDVLYDFRREKKLCPFVGIGAGVVMIGLREPIVTPLLATGEFATAIAGVEFSSGPVTPYVRAQYSWFREPSDGAFATVVGIRLIPARLTKD